MNLELRNCNNIDNANIVIEPNRLNIKYALNGTGKSTIAKAIDLRIKGGSALNDLTPFKYKESKSDEHKPKVNGLDGIVSTGTFNELYINQFAFKQDEVIANSFEIFIKTTDYDQRIAQIELIISEIRAIIKDSTELNQMIKDLEYLCESFGKAKSGYSAAGNLAKGLGKGNRLEHIPEGLEKYSIYLKSSDNVKWIKWQTSGNAFVELSACCPYCTAPTEATKETILKVGKEYDAKTIEHLNSIIQVLGNLKQYFSDVTNNRLDEISRNVGGLSQEEIEYLLQIKKQAETLKEKLVAIKDISFFSFKEVDKAADLFSALKIKIEYLENLNSNKTNEFISKINGAIDTLLSKIGILQGEIAKQKSGIKKTIEENKSEINEFLKCAGYKYAVDVELESDTYKMRLKHLDCNDSLKSGSQHLSYGERNAFSLILFMYECLSKNTDIIILDDPISSFDRNKKYAVIDMLFRRSRSLKGKTVLLMTHDLEPIIDMLYVLPHKFEPIPLASFLNCKNGEITETQILKSDILPFGRICFENIASREEDVIKLLYLRRYFEITNDKGMGYQLLSNLFKKRDVALLKQDSSERNMSNEEIGKGTNEIRKHLPSFDYNAIIQNIKSSEYLKVAYNNTTYNYEKLQIFRVYDPELSGDDIVDKFVKETYHIENDYIMQLNPCKYEVVPQYIVERCTEIIQRVG